MMVAALLHSKFHCFGIIPVYKGQGRYRPSHYMYSMASFSILDS